MVGCVLGCMLGCMLVLVLFLFIVDEFLLQKVVQAKVVHRFNISYTAVSHSAFCTPCGGPASCLFPMVLRSATSAIILFPMVLRSGGLASCVFLMVLLPASPPRRPGQQHLPDSSLPQCPARCFRWLPVPAAPPRRPGQQQTSFGGEDLRFG